MYNTSRNHLPPNGSEPESTDEPLPIILAGPIVRRCETIQNISKTSVNIWLATSKNFDNIFINILNVTNGGNIISPVKSWVSTYKSIEVSKNFWCWMIRVDFDNTTDLQSSTAENVIWKGKNNSTLGTLHELFYQNSSYIADDSTIRVEQFVANDMRDSVSEHLFAYDIFFQEKNITPERDSFGNIKLKSIKDLMGGSLKDITLDNRKLPFFSVQVTGQSLRCLFGSCRKAHGKGKDASIGMELNLLASLNNNKLSFPNALFLTGDQIYADDVHNSLLATIESLVDKLNIKKHIEGPGRHDNNKKAYISKLEFDRKSYSGLSGFTSTDSENHLRDFGEFAAMYLIMWNSKLWDQNSKTKEILKNAYEGTKSIRRVLANVPTYMIIDDHDVTDDFYFDDKWKTQVLQSASGRRVVSHALANYWLFQAWGNTFEGIPENFSEMITGYTMGNESEKYDYDKTFTEYHEWSFIAPTDPPAIFLNTRTQRKSEIEAEDEYRETLSGPILINNDEYTRLADLVKKDSQSRYDNESVIIVSPSPILTLSAVEAGIDLVEKDSLAGDKETFNTNQHTFYQLCQFIGTEIKPAHLIIISGDVHYSTIGFGKLIDLDSKDIYVSQLTSSALKNKVTDGAFYGLWLTIKQIGQSLNKSYYYRRNGRKIESWGQVDGAAKILQNDFSLKYDFVSVGSTRVLYHNRAFLDSNFGFLEKSSSKTTITTSIRNSNNEEYIGFEGDTKKWPI